MSKIDIYGLGRLSWRRIKELADKKEVSISEYCKHVLLNHIKELDEKRELNKS